MGFMVPSGSPQAASGTAKTRGRRARRRGRRDGRRNGGEARRVCNSSNASGVHSARSRAPPDFSRPRHVHAPGPDLWVSRASRPCEFRSTSDPFRESSPSRRRCPTRGHSISVRATLPTHGSRTPSEPFSRRGRSPAARATNPGMHPAAFPKHENAQIVPHQSISLHAHRHNTSARSPLRHSCLRQRRSKPNAPRLRRHRQIPAPVRHERPVSVVAFPVRKPSAQAHAKTGAQHSHPPQPLALLRRHGRPCDPQHPLQVRGRDLVCLGVLVSLGGR